MDTTGPDAGATRIVLDVHTGDQPIHGCLRPQAGRPEEFTGWLELTRALERLISEASPPPGPPPGLRAP
jgi:hypothetical protein